MYIGSRAFAATEAGPGTGPEWSARRRRQGEGRGRLGDKCRDRGPPPGARTGSAGSDDESYRSGPPGTVSGTGSNQGEWSFPLHLVEFLRVFLFC